MYDGALHGVEYRAQLRVGMLGDTPLPVLYRVTSGAFGSRREAITSQYIGVHFICGSLLCFFGPTELRESEQNRISQKPDN